MHTARKAVATLAGVGAVASSMSGALVALAPAANAAPAPGQDVLNDWGQSAAEVTAEINAVVDADSRVIAARNRYAIALSKYASVKSVERVAISAYKSALTTRTKADDAATARKLRAVRAQVLVTAREVVASQLNQVKTVNAVTAAVRAKHYILAPYIALPAQPSGLATIGSHGQVSLSWTAASGVTSYRIFRDGIQVGSASSTTFTDLGLVDGTAYAYTVIAINTAGWSPVSAEVVGIPTPSAPPVPTSLTAAPGDTTVALAWSASTGATGYQVYRAGTLIASVTGTTYTDTGRTNGTSYSYTVMSLNGTVASAASSPVSCTPVSAPPAAPTGLIANAGNASVSVSWTASPGATAYQVHRNGVDIGARTSLTTFLDTTALNNTTYTYTVSAYKQNSGASALSASASATPVAPALSAPTGLAATPGDTTVSLSWNAVSGATSYLVYRNGSLATTTATTSFNDSSLTNSQTYTYYVVASNGTSTSAASATASAKPMAAVAGAPTGLTGQAGDHLVTLTWTGVSGVTQYKVYRGGVLLTTVTGTTYADATAVNNTAYTYYVTAMGTTESAPSTSVTVTPVAITPAVPTGLVPTSGNTQVSLSWTAAANAQSYRVYRGGTLVGSPSTTNFIDTGLTNGTSYTYTVVSVNGSAVSAASAGVSSTPMAPAPGAPTNLVGTPGNNSATLTWTAVANATSYKVYRGGVLLASPTTTTYLDSTVLNGTPYSYWVTAVTATTEGVASATVNVTPAKPPVNGTFTGSIVSIASGHGTIRVVIVVTNNIITTSTGTLLTNDGSETVKINTNALPTYNSKAVTANGTGFTKVSGASLTFAAYKTSMQAAMTAAGI